MKKYKLVPLLISFILLAVGVRADEFNPLIYQYSNPEITIIFSEQLDVSAERQQEIADIVAGVSSTIANPMIASPDNIICTLFGHDTSTSTVTATHHKVKQYDPRCLMEVYHVTACSRCDYTETELQGSFYIFCCPVD